MGDDLNSQTEEHAVEATMGQGASQAIYANSIRIDRLTARSAQGTGHYGRQRPAGRVKLK